MSIGPDLLGVIADAQKRAYQPIKQQLLKPIRLRKEVDGLVFTEFEDVWFVYADGAIREFPKSEWSHVDD